MREIRKSGSEGGVPVIPASLPLSQYSLPSGCQPFSGGIDYPPGIDVMFHFRIFIGYLAPHDQVSWRDV
jgi:hypothetical protein